MEDAFIIDTADGQFLTGVRYSVSGKKGSKMLLDFGQAKSAIIYADATDATRLVDLVARVAPERAATWRVVPAVPR